MKKQGKKVVTAAPVEKNQEILLTIDDLGSKGEGIGRYEGFTVFVEGALPKEVVWVRAVGSSEYTKYTGIADRPREINKPLSSAWSGDAAEGNVSFDFVMYDQIQIPPTGEKDFVELECRIYFDSEHMTNVHQDKTFKITSFKASQS